MTNKSDEDSDGKATTTAVVLSKPAMICAIVVLAIYLVISLLLFVVASKATEVTWTRYVFVYAGLEAVVFAAAGAIFGSKVQRDQTERAEKRADDAETSVQGLTPLAAAGHTLRAAVEAEAEAMDSKGYGTGGLSQGRVGSSGPDSRSDDSDSYAGEDSIARLLIIARKLFDE